jgi:hypothetical protein
MGLWSVVVIAVEVYSVSNFREDHRLVLWGPLVAFVYSVTVGAFNWRWRSLLTKLRSDEGRPGSTAPESN